MMARKMPAQRPGRSETVVVTPEEFVTAVRNRLGIDEFTIDLAALRENRKADIFIDGSYENALEVDWKMYLSSRQWAWLNPPYSDIRPWVEKAALAGCNIAVLVPASVGSNWWRDCVHDLAHVLLLNGRIQFEGHTTGYPKDLALLLYSREYTPGYTVWTWKD